MAEASKGKAELRKDIGRRLRLTRELRKLTQTELANKSHVSQSDISAIERGARGMQPHQRVPLAGALDVDPAVFDPIATPQFDEHALGGAPVFTERVSGSDRTVATNGTSLDDYLERHPELPEPVKWLLRENRHYRTYPFKTITDRTWDRLAQIAQEELAESLGQGGAPGGGSKRSR